MFLRIKPGNQHFYLHVCHCCYRPPVTYLRDHIALQKARESHEVFFVYIGSDSDPLQKKYTSTAAILFTRLSFFSIERNKLPSVSSIFKI